MHGVSREGQRVFPRRIANRQSESCHAAARRESLAYVALKSKGRADLSPARPRVAIERRGAALCGGGQATLDTSLADCVMSTPRRSRLNWIITAMMTATVPATTAIARP